MIDLNTPGDFDNTQNAGDTPAVFELIEKMRDTDVLREYIAQRTREGRYVVTERELVLAIRHFDQRGSASDKQRVRLLSEILLGRCNAAFQRYSYGLRHRPELREEVIANMAVHLLTEVRDSREQFPVLNFVHYLHCVCIDEFNRVLRQEGLAYKRGDDGRPVGRPQHVPRSLVEPIRPVSPDDDSLSTADVADPQDQFEQLHANEEASRILLYLSDALDRKIMVLRVLNGMKWDDIATLCGKTERTLRLRYERARKYLQERLADEQAGYIPVVSFSTTRKT